LSNPILKNHAQKSSIYLTGAFCMLFIIAAFLIPDLVKTKMGEWTASSMGVFGGFYLWFGLAAVILLGLIAFSPLGSKRLGPERAEYSWFSWISMLYSTGMGAGLLLRAVQEPVFYYTHPPRGSVYSASEFALQYTFFHWGLTPWAFYGLFGLIISYNLYVRQSSILGSAILGDRMKGNALSIGMDSLITICTLLGVVAAVGLGSRQLLDAMVYWTGIESPDSRNAIYLLLSVCILATLSAYLGVSKGIRILSNLNIGMATSLLIFAWIIGNEWSLAASLFRTMGAYIWEFIPMSLNLGSQKVSESFLTDWTYFYWAFWLAWAPFTGVFIARISKGRTIRQFIVGVLLVPALGTFLWFTVFGSNAFLLIETGQVVVGQFESIYSGIFNFFGAFPFSKWSSAIATLLVFTFLITSVDSAIFVLSMFSDEGKTEPNKVFRLFWGVSIALFTIGLILVGKDQLLESVSQMLILAALPFSLTFCGMVIYFIYGLYPSKK